MAERRKAGGGVKGEKKKSCAKKRKNEKNAVINQKGGRGLPHVAGLFFPNNLDTTVVLTKDVQRPVCTDEMRDFVIPTLSIF